MTFQTWVGLQDFDGVQDLHSFSPACKVPLESFGWCDHLNLFSGALKPLDAF